MDDNGGYEFESNYKDNTESSNVGEIVGRIVGDVTQSDNTYENVDIWNPKGDTFTVSSVTALKAFAMDVDDGNTYEGKTVKLTADIDLEAYDENGEPVSFNPIGDSTHPFKGTFDGIVPIPSKEPLMGRDTPSKTSTRVDGLLDMSGARMVPLVSLVM